MGTARFIVGDVFDVMRDMEDDSVDLVMTSPPFLALRSYLPADHPDKGKEIGSEATPAEFLDTLLALTAEWRRLLAPHGSICVELGDTYSGSGGAGGDYDEGGLRDGQERFDGSASRLKTRKRTDGGQYANHHGARTKYNEEVERPIKGSVGWPLAKSLCGIPHLYHLSLACGRNLLTGQPSPAGQWRVRNVVAWVRPNPPVGALGDKVRPATSHLTWACVSDRRWFDLDAVRTAHKSDPSRYSGNGYSKGAPEGVEGEESMPGNPAGAPPLDWWCIPPGGYPGSHYAVYPPELLRIPIDASRPRRVCRTCGKPSRRQTHVDGLSGRDFMGAENDRALGHQGKRDAMPEITRTTTGWSTCGCPGTDGIRLDGYHTGTGWRAGHVLDPFGGSGTTAVVATGLGRDCTLIDLDERNADLARDRLGMFLEVDHGTRERSA